MDNTDDPVNWSELEPLLEQALELKPSDRATFLRSHLAADVAGRVAQALNSEVDLESEDLREPIAGFVRSLAGEVRAEGQPKVVGPYTILGRLGRGGMGEVFAARRTDGSLDRKIALKLIRRDRLLPGAEQRFQRERDVLSALQHENIAQIVDAGVSEDGSSYFAMELVDGAPIDDYCDQAGLPLLERLRLMESVANAVDFAHQNLILHRDLKPSNIVVTDRSSTAPQHLDRDQGHGLTQATVKLLDFGVAKLLGAEAVEADDLESQFVLLTPRYASPEQRRGERLTTASDVYSLGMVLRRLVGEEADSDSAPVALPKDLRIILDKALEEDRNHRYQSAAELAADLRRFRSGLPISIRRASLSYVAQKMIRRQPVASAVAAAAIVGLLIAGALILNQWRIAEAERTVADSRTREAAEVNDLLFSIYEDLEYTHHDHEATHAQMRQVLERTQARLDVQLASASDSRAGLDLSLAHLYMQNGDHETARDLLEATMADLPLDADPILRANAWYRLGEIAVNQRDFALAADHLTEALKLQIARFGEHDRLTLRTQIMLGRSEGRLGQHEASVARLETAVATARQLYPDPHPDLQWALRRLGFARSSIGDVQGAVEAHRESLPLARLLYGKHSRRTRIALSELISVLKQQGEFIEAREHAIEYLESQRSTQDRGGIGNAHILLAEVEREAGALSEAERNYRHLLSEFDEDLSRVRQARARTGLGMTLLFQGRRDEAEAWLADAISRYDERRSPGSITIAKAYLALAKTLSGDASQLERAREHQTELEAMDQASYDFHARQIRRLMREAEVLHGSGPE